MSFALSPRKQSPRSSGSGPPAPQSPRATPRAPEPIPSVRDELDDADSGALLYADAKALRESYLARKAKLDFLQAQGRLLPLDAIEAKWSRIVIGARNRLLACSARIGARIAHLSKIEIETIDKEIRTALSELGDSSC
jgi:hypothetical protein